MSITIIRFEKCVCDECNVECKGVRFQLLGDPRNVAFLCWLHWRANTEVLLEAGILIRAPRRSVRGRTETEHTSVGETDGISRSYGWCESESRSVSVGRTAGSTRTETRGESR